MSAVTSPDISNLDFTVLFDISGATPAITLTNASTVINPTQLVWWYVITTPSNTPIHTGSVSDPDVENVAWATLSITPGSWPQPFGTGPCAQIEFSCNAPYIVTLYVKDSADTTFSLSKTATICRPTGSTANSCGNFGEAALSIKTDCMNARLVCQDNTNYSYQGQLSAYAQSNTWTLVYPQSPSGSQPTNGTASNTPTVFFNLAFGGDGFNIYIRDYATYSMGDGVFIKLQYKAHRVFNVYCNIDLCQLQCEMDRFFKETVATCGELESADAYNKMSQINFLYAKILTGILQPLCDIDVPAEIVKMEKLFGFPSTCCCNKGVNMSMAPVLPTSSDCCTTSVAILDKVTGLAPANCPNSYFPVQVYDPTWTTIIGVASDVDNLVAILNENAAWLAYGVAINAGNCNVGFILEDTTVTVPAVKVATSSSACVGDTQYYSVRINDLCLGNLTASLGNFPMNTFVDFGLGDGEVFLGNVSDIGALIILLNSTPTKPATITFSNGSSSGVTDPVIINIRNSSCVAYSGTITITCDIGSSAYLLYGASHLNYVTSPAPISGAEVGFGLRSNAVIGKIPGVSDDNIQWHSIRIGNTLIISEGDTGKILFYDITNPLYPSFIRYIQLNAVVAACFTGLPQSRGIPEGAGSVVNSFYSLYFPTDYSNMSLSAIYVFEGLTGSAWKLDMYAAGSGVTASFQDNSLIGSCPRVITGPANNLIFFTMDGSLGPDIGAPILTPGYINVLDLTATFDGSGLSTKEIIGSSFDQVWAASYNGIDTIWFMGQNGTLAKYDVWTDTVTAVVVNAMGVGQNFELRGNIKNFGPALYCSSLGGFKPLGSVTGALFVNIASFPTVSATLFTDPTTIAAANPPLQYVHNILPLGNCLVLVTTEGYEDAYLSTAHLSTAQGAIATYKINGTYIMGDKLPVGQNIYNLVPISGIPVYTPTSLIPD
jgi:hypothetical protein